MVFPFKPKMHAYEINEHIQQSCSSDFISFCFNCFSLLCLFYSIKMYQFIQRFTICQIKTTARKEKVHQYLSCIFFISFLRHCKCLRQTLWSLTGNRETLEGMLYGLWPLTGISSVEKTYLSAGKKGNKVRIILPFQVSVHILTTYLLYKS